MQNAEVRIQNSEICCDSILSAFCILNSAFRLLAFSATCQPGRVFAAIAVTVFLAHLNQSQDAIDQLEYISSADRTAMAALSRPVPDGISRAIARRFLTV